jgi:hypothetical protein
MEREEIIVNLKLLESVQKMQKLTTRDVFLNIEPESLIPECFRRWKRQDGRDNTIKKINEIVNCSIVLVEQKDTAIKDYLVKSSIGIANLKETYAACKQTCARIDTILDKIKLIDDKDVIKEVIKECLTDTKQPCSKSTKIKTIE